MPSEIPWVFFFLLAFASFDSIGFLARTSRVSLKNGAGVSMSVGSFTGGSEAARTCCFLLHF
jgi:hypothetical protein